jgi:hypothetical protein
MQPFLRILHLNREFWLKIFPYSIPFKQKYLNIFLSFKLTDNNEKDSIYFIRNDFVDYSKCARKKN